MVEASIGQDEIIKFIRQRDYEFVRELGQGACGRTVLLYDQQIDQHFVCKKFTPYSEQNRKELFSNFVRETKILHQIYHQNVVRVFNYHLYPDQYAGFIIMEFVEGSDIDKYLTKSPELINELFLQTISGFRYLEINNILHRDIRPPNLMVNVDGNVKIIDFGFGKQVRETLDFDKSVSLNWWCELPNEFSDCVYDFKTEVYFVGKLFERIIHDNEIDQFKYKAMLGNMCERDPGARIQGFVDIEKEIQSDRFYVIGFSEEERTRYRNFADCIVEHIIKLANSAKYQDNMEKIQIRLENAYRSFMLEEYVPNSALIIRCIIDGSYYYKKNDFPVDAVEEFLHLLKSSSLEKKRIIFSNLHTRLDSITRYDPEKADMEDLPF
jgi:serine/threonine-protein kinase